MIAFLSTLFSCNKATNNEPKKTEKFIGSTLENINNSEHAVIQFQIDNKICFATINQSFKSYKNKSSFPFSLWITVETKNKNDSGHPVESEANLFNNLENSLIDKFILKTPFCYIGRTTRDGYRELMFYVSDENKAKEVINEFIKENTFKRKIEFVIDNDPNWESVGAFY